MKNINRFLTAVLLGVLFAGPCAAGPTGGTRTASCNLDPGKSVIWTVAYDKYSKGQLNTIGMVFVRQRSTPVSLFLRVKDDGDVSLTASGDGSFMGLTWFPPANQTYTIEIFNGSKDKSATLDVSFE